MRKNFIKLSLRSSVIRVLGMAISLAVAVILARLLGAEGYGIYAFSISVVMLISSPLQAGLSTLVVRETTKLSYQALWSELAGLIRWCLRSLSILTLIGLVCSICLAYYFVNTNRYNDAVMSFISFLLVPLIIMGGVRGGLLRGLGYTQWSQIVEQLLTPVLFITFIIVANTLLSQGDLEPYHILLLQLSALIVSILVSTAVIKGIKPKELIFSQPSSKHLQHWKVSVIPLSLIGSVQFLNKNADILMLGALSQATNVGTYKVAMQCAMMLGFFLQTVNMVAGPTFARLYSAKSMDELQRFISFCTRLIFFVSLPIMIVIYVFSKDILLLIFGVEYISASTPLRILIIGHLINAAMGSVVSLLNMTGHEKDTLKGISVAVLLNILLNALLIPRLGGEGAAIATTITFFVWNTLLWLKVKQRLGIDSSIFARR